MKKKVVLIFGGKSAEHEISFLSARNVCAALDREKFEVLLVGISQEGTWYTFASDEIFQKIKSLSDKTLTEPCEPCALICREGKPQLYELNSRRSISIDIAFPILHGTFGEDGCIQGQFKMANLPFVGCGVLGSAVGMDKEAMKRILIEAKVPTARYLLLTPEKPLDYREITSTLGSPFFIKPANMGSSVGVHKIKSQNDFETSLQDSFLYDHKVLAEEFIEGREIECSVMGHNATPKASTCGEVSPSHEFYSYEAKYLDEKGAALQIPAKMDPDVLRKIQNIACRTFQVMGCEGMTRVDFFLKKSGEVLVNEINTIPGFTRISMYPKMWEASGLGYSALISELIQLGFETYEREQRLQTKFPGV